MWFLSERKSDCEHFSLRITFTFLEGQEKKKAGRCQEISVLCEIAFKNTMSYKYLSSYVATQNVSVLANITLSIFSGMPE